MRFTNSNNSKVVSVVLDAAYQALRSRDIVGQRNVENDGEKGELVVELAFALGTGIATSVIYDAIKVSIVRILQSQPEQGTQIIEIDGKKYELKQVPNQYDGEN